MNKLQKILLISLSVLVLGVFLITLFVRLYFTDDRIRGIAEPFLEEQLGRDVTIGGFEVRVLKSWPDVAVGITDISIHSPQKDSISVPDLASVRKIWVQVPLAPLLQSKIQVNKLELDQPRVLVEVYEDLSSNLIDMSGNEVSSNDKNVSQSESKTNIALENIRIRQGQIGYVQADGTLLTLDNISTDLSIRLAEKAIVDGNMSVSNAYFESGGLSYIDNWKIVLDLATETHLDSAWIRIDQADLSIEDVVLDLNGSVSDYDSDSIDVNLSFVAPQAPVSSFWSLLPEILTKDLDGLESSGTFSVEGDLVGIIADEILPSLRADLSVIDGIIQYPGFASSINNINVDAQITSSNINVRSFFAEADGAKMNLVGGLEDFSNPSLDAELDFDIDLDRIDQYYPLEDSTNLGGSLNVNVLANGALNSVDDLQIAGDIELNSVKYESSLVEQPIEDLSGEIRLERDQIAFNDISLVTGRSDLQLNGVLTGYQALVTESSTQLHAPVFVGDINSNFLDLTEQLSEDTTTTFVGPIELPSLDLQLKLNVDELEFNGIVFGEASGEVLVDDGIIGVEDIEAQFLNGVLYATGNFDLRDPFSPAFNGEVRLSKLPVKEFFATFSEMDAILRLGSYLDGLFDSEASFGLTLDKDLNPLYESVVASGSFGASQGSFGTMPLQSALAAYTGVTALNNLSVQDWSHSFTVSGSLMHLQNLELNAGEYAVFLSGTQSFDGGIDYRFSIELPESASNMLANAPVQGALSSLSSVVTTSLKDPDSGRITLDLLATGTITDPSIKLDADEMKTRLVSSLEDGLRNKAQSSADSLEQVARERVEEELTEQRQAIEERAEEGLEQLVGGLTDSTFVEMPIDSLKEKGADALQDRLKGLLNRRKRNN